MTTRQYLVAPITFYPETMHFKNATSVTFDDSGASQLSTSKNMS